MKTQMQRLRASTRLYRSRLSQKIILGMFISLAVIEGILLIPSVQRRQAELLNQIEKVSTGQLRWVVITYPAASGAELLEHLQALQGNPTLPDILGGAVYSADGQRIGTFGEPPTLTPAEAQQTRRQLVSNSAGHRYDIAWTTAGISEGMLPTLTENHWLILRHDARDTQRTLGIYMLRVTGIVLLIAAFVTLVMMVLLYRQVIIPILTLRRDLALAGETVACDQITPEFDSLGYLRQDELGEVIATFQQMYAQINQAICDRRQAEAALRRQNQDMQQYIQQVNKVTVAAAAVDEGRFKPQDLAEVAERGDPLGQLARMFQLMASSIEQREQQLKQQLLELTIEVDRVRVAQQVAEITESSYFQEIQAEISQYQGEDFWRK